MLAKSLLQEVLIGYELHWEFQQDRSFDNVLLKYVVKLPQVSHFDYQQQRLIAQPVALHESGIAECKYVARLVPWRSHREKLYHQAEIPFDWLPDFAKLECDRVNLLPSQILKPQPQIPFSQ